MRKLLLLLFLVPGLLDADVVYLKGGGRFSGRILEQTAEKVVIDFGDGTIGLQMDQIEEITRGASPLDEFDSRAKKLGPQDVDGWRSLALWASTKGLSAQSRAAYKKVLARAPDDQEAREALGYVQVDGRWLTEEEGYRARGFVKYDGEWMTPAEVKLAQANAQERDEADKRASDAQFSASMARLQKLEDEERARDEADRMRNNPVYMSGWGYGVTSWPYWPNPARVSR